MHSVTVHRRLAVALFLAVWVVTSISFSYSERVQREAEVTPVHCLLFAALPLAIFLPLCVDRVMKWRLFRLYWALWCGITVPGTLLLFRWAAGLSGKCDHLMYGGGLFAMAVIGLQGALIQHRERRRSRLERTARPVAAPGGEPPTADSPSVVGWTGGPAS